MEANQEILIESDPSFYMRLDYNRQWNHSNSFFCDSRYLNIEVLSPCIEEGFNVVRPITPHEVRSMILITVRCFDFDISVVFVICPIRRRLRSTLNTHEGVNVSYAKV